MSYDPPRSARHRAPAPSWDQGAGYADAFDGAQQGYGAYQEQNYGGYQEQNYGGYQEPAYGGYQEPAYGSYGASGYAPSGPALPASHPSGPMLRAPDEQSWNDFASGTGRQETTVPPPGRIAGGTMGVVAAGLAIGIATLAAAFFRPQASPIIAVGEWFIDHTPSWLKEFAIQKFGEHDKTMLLLGMYVTIAFLAIGIGVVARRRITVGVVGLAVFGLLGAYIAYTRPASKFSDVVPSIIGAAAGVAALLWMGQAAGVPELTPGGRS
ncbi:MAG TPA: hypothetical protein VF070_08275 [Streptosporangiaceae bacterium]